MALIKNSLRQFGVLTLALVLSSCSIVSYQPTWKTDKEYKLTLLHTNDHHGHFWHSPDGNYGMAARKALIDNIREEVVLNDGRSLLFSAGDINTGTPISDLLNAEPDFKGMNLLQYDAMVLGDHEFDHSRDILLQQQVWAGIPFLSANVISKETGQPLFDAYKIFEVEDLKIAVVGFTTEDILKTANPEYLQDLEIIPTLKAAEKLVPKLRRQADLVVALTHIGYYEDGNNGEHATGDVTLARSIPGIDVIVGGHSQTPLVKADQQNGSLIVQAHKWGQQIGRLDLVIKNGAIESSDYRLIPVNQTNVTPDQAMLALLTPYQDQGLQALEEGVGLADNLFIGDRAVIRNKETNLSNLITTAMREKVGADVGITHAGSINDNIDEGIVSYQTILNTLPMAHSIAYVDFNTQELTDYVAAVAQLQAGTTAFAQFSGISFIMLDGLAVDIKVNGKALNASKRYRLAVNSDIATGAEGYPNISDHPTYIDSGYRVDRALVTYFQQHGVVSGADFTPVDAVMR